MKLVISWGSPHDPPIRKNPVKRIPRHTERHLTEDSQGVANKGEKPQGCPVLFCFLVRNREEAKMVESSSTKIEKHSSHALQSWPIQSIETLITVCAWMNASTIGRAAGELEYNTSWLQPTRGF